MYKLTLAVFILCAAIQGFSQDIKLARNIIDSLCSESFGGRGYENQSDLIAADFIATKMAEYNVQPLTENYLQYFNIAVNTFPSDIEIYLDDTKLIAGKDFILSSASGPMKGEYKLTKPNNYRKLIKKLSSVKMQREVLIVDQTLLSKDENLEVRKIIFEGNCKVPGIIMTSKGKLMFGKYPEALPFGLIEMNDSLIENRQSIKADFKNEFLPEHRTQNVCGIIKGDSDSMIVFTAHYDHLGRLGKETYFPGASDNASGVAMLLDLARHYSASEERPEYSIVFLFFSAEEVGLLGSFHFVKNPLVELSKIKFLLNLDLVGGGDDGIQIVNSSVFEKEYELLDSLNQAGGFLKAIKKRGEAANSDHYPFFALGVPSFFIYTLGGAKEYHNIYDTPSNLPLTEYEDLFLLLTKFVSAYE